LKVGVYTVRDEEGKPIGTAKLHLREEPDGTGILIINANHVVYLNKTAKDHVELIIEGKTVDEAVKILSKKYKAKKEVLKRNHEKILLFIESILKEGEICPFSFFGVKPIEPFSKEISKPFRIDLALTYKCNNNCLHCYSSSPRQKPELSTKEWKKIIDLCAKLEIPQIVFTGGEPTLREDLPELVRHAQDKGIVTGLLSNGRLLGVKKDLAEKLVKAGLDYVQITIESCIEEEHDKITRVPGSWRETIEGIKNSVKAGIYTTTNTTITRINHDEIEKLIEMLYNLGVKNVGFNALIYAGRAVKTASELALPIEQLKTVLDRAKHKAHELGIPITWYTPTKYCELNPVKMGLGVKSCSAARITLCVEPDGTVIPCQSWFQPLGNILKDKWGKIWNHEVCKYARAAKWLPEECRDCPWVSVCRGGCPLKLGEKAVRCGECYR